MLGLLILLAVAFAFLNGYRDSSSIMASAIASRSLSPRTARVLAAISEFLAPFLFGSAVAKSLTTGLVRPESISIETIVIGTAAALVWTLFAWKQGIPSSSSHALVGGIIGATWIVNGWDAIIASGLIKVVLPLLLAPVLGLLVGFIVMELVLFFARGATPRINSSFKRLQIVTMVGLFLAHSANDAQKSTGLIALGLYLTGRLSQFTIPIPVVAVCAAAIAFGASRGDWRLIRTLGSKIYRIRPADAFTSQAASAAIIMGSSLAGAPVSTSQVISTALLGAGAAERVSKVRWQVGKDMLLTWVVTIPSTLVLAAVLAQLARLMDYFIQALG